MLCTHGNLHGRKVFRVHGFPHIDSCEYLSYFSLCVCACACVSGYVCVCTWVQVPLEVEGWSLPSAGGPGSCELPDMSVEEQSWVLYKSSTWYQPPNIPPTHIYWFLKPWVRQENNLSSSALQCLCVTAIALKYDHSKDMLTFYITVIQLQLLTWPSSGRATNKGVMEVFYMFVHIYFIYNTCVYVHMCACKHFFLKRPVKVQHIYSGAKPFMLVSFFYEKF